MLHHFANHNYNVALEDFMKEELRSRFRFCRESTEFLKAIMKTT